jgi:hypothetical protein
MEEARVVVVKWIGKDVYRLLLRYILKALRGQFDLLKPLSKWPRSSLKTKLVHPVFKYFAKHALITIEAFYEFCKEASLNFTFPIKVQRCLCGETIASNVGGKYVWLYKEKRRSFECKEAFLKGDPIMSREDCLTARCCESCSYKLIQCRYSCRFMIFEELEYCGRSRKVNENFISKWEEKQLVPF